MLGIVNKFPSVSHCNNDRRTLTAGYCFHCVNFAKCFLLLFRAILFIVLVNFVCLTPFHCGMASLSTVVIVVV